MIPSVDWWMTSHCTLKCDFCLGPVPGEDPRGLRELIVRALQHSSAKTVTFCGGEPLIVRRVADYARILRAHGKHTILNTNGELLLKRCAKGMKLPFDVVGISIDGSTAAMHKTMRGQEARFDSTWASARYVSAQPDIKLKIATVVSVVNAEDVPRIGGAVRSLDADVWRLYQYAERGIGAQNHGQDRHIISSDEFERIARLAVIQASPVPVVPASEETGAGCMIVDMQGDVLLPVEHGYIKRGNCLEERLDDIWERIPERAVVERNKRWQSITLPPSAPHEPRSASAPREPRASAPAS